MLKAVMAMCMTMKVAAIVVRPVCLPRLLRRNPTHAMARRFTRQRLPIRQHPFTTLHLFILIVFRPVRARLNQLLSTHSQPLFIPSLATHSQAIRRLHKWHLQTARPVQQLNPMAHVCKGLAILLRPRLRLIPIQHIRVQLTPVQHIPRQACLWSLQTAHPVQRLRLMAPVCKGRLSLRRQAIRADQPILSRLIPPSLTPRSHILRRLSQWALRTAHPVQRLKPTVPVCRAGQILMLGPPLSFTQVMRQHPQAQRPPMDMAATAHTARQIICQFASKAFAAFKIRPTLCISRKVTCTGRAFLCAAQIGFPQPFPQLASPVPTR